MKASRHTVRLVLHSLSLSRVFFSEEFQCWFLQGCSQSWSFHSFSTAGFGVNLSASVSACALGPAAGGGDVEEGLSWMGGFLQVINAGCRGFSVRACGWKNNQ